jgi:hypothetical protein
MAHTEEIRNSYEILVRKPVEKRPHERTRHKKEDNIRMDRRKIGCKGVDQIHLVQDTDW